MAGLRASIVVSITSFLLGLLFTHWTADLLTLWKAPVTDEHLWASAAYYGVLATMPPALAYAIAAVAVLGGSMILWSLRDGEAGNLMFDGGSIFLFATAAFVYANSVLPSIIANFAHLPIPSTSPLYSAPFPPALRAPTLDVASSHLVCSVALTGVLALQAGRWWAEQKDGAGERRGRKSAAGELNPVDEEKIARRKLRKSNPRRPAT